MMFPIIVTLTASAVIGFAVGRAIALAVPVAALAIFYAGLNAGLWGNGVGDGWYYPMAILMLVGIAGAFVGLAARVALPGARTRRIA